jgi:hypothetical protein
MPMKRRRCRSASNNRSDEHILAAHVSGHFQDSEYRERVGRPLLDQLYDAPVGVHGERIAGVAALARMSERSIDITVSSTSR